MVITRKLLECMRTAFCIQGTFEGNYKTIYNLNINVGNKNGSYGLFSQLNNGIIKNLTIRGVKINSTAMNSLDAGASGVGEALNIGTIAGLSSGGWITNCHVYGKTSYKTISVSSYYNTNVGGIVGFNYTRITDCTVNNVNMNVSSDAGGIAGTNTVCEIANCTVNNVHITYVWNTENACIGGVVGFNGDGGTVSNCSNNCSSTSFIAFTWHSQSDLDTSVKKTIYPSIGFVIGENSGTYSGLSSNLDKDDNTDIDYEWRLLFPNFDQSKRMFKVDGGNVGYQG